MKNRYIAINGFAFSEKLDMEKLSNYAKDGWLLEGIVGGFFYKLKKDVPRDIIYSLDNQLDSNEEYFTIMREAGWEHIVSVGCQYHIFSAKTGTKPIYSDNETEQDKYITVRNQTKKGSLYTLITGVVLCLLMIIADKIYEPLFYLVLGLFVVDIVLFVFNFIPYVAYNFRVSQSNNGDKQNNEIKIMKGLNKLFLFLGTLLIALGVFNIINKGSVKGVAISIIILGCFTIISTLISQRKDKSINK